MSGILTPGYLRWDGTKYVLDQDIEIVGPPGSQGPEGPTGPAGPPGPFGVASGDLLGTYPGPIAVVGLTGIGGVVNFGVSIPNPTITQVATGGTTGQTMTYKAQNAATFGGNVVLQSGTGTTAGLVQFLVGNTLAGYFDANRTLRIGPNATSTFIGPNGVSPLAGTDYFFGGNSGGSMMQELFTAAASHRAGVAVYNTAAGGTATNGISIQAPGSAFSIGNYASNAVIEQTGASTSCLVLGAVAGDGTSRTVSGRIFQSGAWTVGDLTTGSSSFTQAGLVGPLLSFGRVTGGTLTTTGGQALIYKTFFGGNDQGTLFIQANTSVNLQSATTTVAGTTNTKFITFQGRRLKVTTITSGSANPFTIANTDEFISLTTINAPWQVNLPASPTTGDTYTIKDSNGQAGLFNITVSGNGNNIDGFASIVLMTNYTQALFTYNGTSWISALCNNVSPNAGYTSVVNVASGGTTNVVGFDQLIVCDPTSASCTVTAPATPQVNMRFTVKDATNTASVGRPIIVNGNGRTLENPQSPGTYTSPINITSPSISATWAYDPTRNRYTIV